MVKIESTTNSRIPFSQRLFWSIFAMFLGFTACFLLFQYQREREFAQEKLNNVLGNYNYQLFRRTQQTEDINQVVHQFIDDIPQKDLRVTIIDPAGKVLFDNSGAEEFNNHNDRSEGFEDYVRYGKEIGIEVIRAKAYTSNIEIENVPNVPVSSSLIRKLLHQGEVDLAADCLKYEYFLDGIVVGGYQVGRKIGFPTANLSVDDPDKLIPADGVYAVWVTFDKKTYMGMLNIGVRPTIDNGPNRTIEVNILHFHSDIYDKFIRLTFVKRTRPELKFSSIDELIVQLHKDAEETEAILLASKAGSNSRETK